MAAQNAHGPPFTAGSGLGIQDVRMNSGPLFEETGSLEAQSRR